MSGFILLLWISIIVILNVRGEDSNDTSDLCKYCDSNILLECLESVGMEYSSVIHCSRSEQDPCAIALSKKSTENIEIDNMCLLKKDENKINNFTEAKDLSDVLDEQQTTTTIEVETENALSHNNMTADNNNKVGTENPEKLTELEPTTESAEDGILQQAITTERITDFERGTNVVSATLTGTQNFYDLDTVTATTADATISMDRKVENDREQFYENAITTQHTDLFDYPQADQAMPEVNIADEKPMLEVNNNGIEAPDLKNADSQQSKTVEAAHEMEPKINSIENSNAGMLTENTAKCFGCLSTEEPNCVTKPTKEIACKTVGDTPVGCFTLIKDSQLIRGCLRDLDEQQTHRCYQSEDRSCNVCYGESCNNEYWPQCYVCNSSLEQPLCALWSPDSSVVNLIKLCPAFDDLCRLEINEHGATTRSCVAKGASCGTTANCRHCNTSLCNGEVFPLGRLRCHQCDDAKNCTLEHATHTPLACPIFVNDDACYLYANVMGQMQRGCRSSVEKFNYCMEYGEKRCLTCITSNGCNSQSLMVEPKLSCSQCDTRVRSSPSSMDCAWRQLEESVSACKNKFLYYLDETCEMIYQPDIELAVRGCSHDIGPCESSYEGCNFCSSRGCNVESFVSQYCLQCSSEHVEGCGNNAKEISSEECKSRGQYFEVRGCYTSVNWDTNVTTRGCISDLTTEEKHFCETDKMHCVFCYEQGCNNLLISSNANSVFMENGFRLTLLGFIYSLL